MKVRVNHLKPKLDYCNPKSLLGFEPIVIRGNWFEVKDLNHSPTDAPCYLSIKILKRKLSIIGRCQIHLHFSKSIDGKKLQIYLDD
jgi:hypothetical protein